MYIYEIIGTFVFILSFFLVIKEWLKRDSVEDISRLREHPSIIKYLAGQKTDGKLVMKVFLSEDNEKAETVFRKICKIAEGMEMNLKTLPIFQKKCSKKIRTLKSMKGKLPH